MVPENWVKSRESQVPDTEGNCFFIVVPENWVKSRESQVPDTNRNCLFFYCGARELGEKQGVAGS